MMSKLSLLPTVSVCIPTRDRADELADRLSELEAQTLQDHEVVVVDDGSGDHTSDVVKASAAKDPRVRYVRLDPPAGIPGAVERCLQEAQGELIAFFHDHDSYAPHALERLACALDQEPDAGFAFCAVTTVDPDTGSRLAHDVGPPDYGRRCGVLDHFVRTGACAVAGSAVILRSSRLPPVPFPPELGAFADVGLWCALSAAGPTPYVNESLATVQGWTQQDAVGKLNWAMLGELGRLRLKYVPVVVRPNRWARGHQRAKIVVHTARGRLLFMARVARLAARAEPIPERAAAGAPQAVASLVRAARTLAHRRGTHTR